MRIHAIDWRLLVAVAGLTAVSTCVLAVSPTSSRPSHSSASATPNPSRSNKATPNSTGVGSNGAADFRIRIAWQIALDREGFSPGTIDGKIGSKTKRATRQFQKANGLPETGELDPATATVLHASPENAVIAYTVQNEDAHRIAPIPKTWPAKAAVQWMGYESVHEAVAERFHCSRELLVVLNPGRDLTQLKSGDVLSVPNVVAGAGPLHRSDSLSIDLSAKTISVLDSTGHCVALFHCSVAAKESNLPTRDGRVATISHEPTYLFDPKMWPEVKGVDRKLVIPPGPRNPVGRCWIGLSLPGYGIHGTPNPELIGKTGSHGCIRLTNWDAVRLARMVSVGTPVRFVRGASDRVASAGR